MDSLNNHVLHDFRFFRAYKDGRIETFRSTHVFHLRKPDSEKAIDLVNKFAAFIK
jgi:hypothetical protein